MNMNSKTRFPLAGASLIFIASVHTVMGVALLAAGDQDTELSFWFTLFGVVGVGLGLAMIDLERARGFVPAPVLGTLALVTACGLIYQPLSGFVTLLVPVGVGAFGWWRARNALVAA
ncbi:hypothetical protein FNL39_103336 [Nocardia caishijiensis]|uniref:Uncharacterized protein n=2 Tax=Nocardia caishijiensis TaxID=184756 RepID=A0ABQ6YNR0_9NOCA|nr:hypothetical protein FNL39_103336 [Nocardia caishijiensis]